MPLFSIEVCLSPALFPFYHKRDDRVVIVIDVFRASTSMVAAFDHGVKKIIPVETLDEALAMKQRGFLVAGERDGKKLDFSDFGNSPLEFASNRVESKTLAFTTTNGTQAIKLAIENHSLFIGAFTNMYSLSNWISNLDVNVLILCAGWKNRFSLEDTVCAGAIVELLSEKGKHRVECDAAKAALNLWENAKSNLKSILKNSEHAKRLIALDQEEDLEYCLSPGLSLSIPVYHHGAFVELNNLKNS